MNIVPTPRFNSTGFQDYQTPVQQTDTPIPAHLPLLFLLTNKGSTDVKILPSDKVVSEYGVSSFDEVNPCYNHQTQLASAIIPNNASVAVKRITLPGASRAIIRIALELAPSTIPLYERDVEGKIVYHVVDGVTVPKQEAVVYGTKLIWHNTQTTSLTHDFGNGNVILDYRKNNENTYSAKLGNLINLESHGETTGSILYPIMDIEIKDIGSYGNNIGIILDKLVKDTNFGPDYTLVESIRTMIYKLRVVEKNNISYRVLNTNGRDTSIKFALSSTTVDPNSGNSLYLTDTILPYILEEDQYSAGKPLGRIHVYENNISEVLSKLYNGYDYYGIGIKGEKDYRDNLTDNPNMLDLLTAHTLDDVPYHTFICTETEHGGMVFSDGFPIYGSGGSDGWIKTPEDTYDYLEILAAYDREVRSYIKAIVDGNTELGDKARYPISAIWDSGYSLETKKAIISLMGFRSDIVVFLSTFTQAEFVTIEDRPGIEIRPIISCTGAQQDVAIRLSQLNIYEVELDGRVLGTNLDYEQMINILRQQDITVDAYQMRSTPVQS